MRHFLFTILFFLTACQGRQDTGASSNPSAPVPAPVPAATPSAPQGTVAGGGGNGVNGRPLESYTFNWTQAADLEKELSEVIKNVAVTSKRLASDLLHIKVDRIWYNVPIDLDQIPPETLGVYFKVDQEAIQNFGEIWLNELIFSKQSPQDQLNLVIHELSVGVFLLSRTSDLDHCLAKVSLGILGLDKKTVYGDDRKKCFDQNPLDRIANPIADKLNLSNDDYRSIRYLSNAIIGTKGLIDNTDFEKELESKGFNLY